MINSREELRGAQQQIEELLEILDEMRREEPPQFYAILCKSYAKAMHSVYGKFSKRSRSILALRKSSLTK